MEKLRKWKKDNKMPTHELAAKAGVSYTSMYRYLRGHRTPEDRVKVAINTLTHGAVSPNDWLL